MGPLLRGDAAEGPQKEAAIIHACEQDHWAPSLLACVARAPEPETHDCLTSLTEEQRSHFGEVTAEWTPREDEIDEAPTCDVAFASAAVDLWPPAVDIETERALAATLRGASLRGQCESEAWSDDARRCISQTPSSAITQCFDHLDAKQRILVDKAIYEADGARARIVKVREKPEAIACDKVVAAHYGNARWTGKAPELTGRARTTAIARSRKAMLSACTASWSVEARACTVAVDSDACVSFGVTLAAWSYPLRGAAPFDIPECDAYRELVDRARACREIDDATKAEVEIPYRQISAGWNDPNLERKVLATVCRAAINVAKPLVAPCT